MLVDNTHNPDMINSMMEIQQLRAENKRLRDALYKMLQAMKQYEMDVDEPAPHKHRKLMQEASAALNGGGND